MHKASRFAGGFSCKKYLTKVRKFGIIYYILIKKGIKNLNITEFANTLGVRPKGDEVPYYMACEAQRLGYLIIFGSSDDLVEICGKRSDELDAFRPTTFYVSQHRIYTADETHPAAARPVHAEYSQPTAAQPSLWKFKTDIPHATFDIMEDGELYCRGLVIDTTNIN